MVDHPGKATIWLGLRRFSRKSKELLGSPKFPKIAISTLWSLREKYSTKTLRRIFLGTNNQPLAIWWLATWCAFSMGFVRFGGWYCSWFIRAHQLRLVVYPIISSVFLYTTRWWSPDVWTINRTCWILSLSQVRGTVFFFGFFTHRFVEICNSKFDGNICKDYLNLANLWNCPWKTLNASFNLVGFEM